MESLIKHLKIYAKLEDSIDVERFEATLNQIAELNDPQCIGFLIPFFNDDCDFDEVMFSIIHVIESFTHETFVREILKALPVFWKHSPFWATIIHLRILNTPSALAIYRDQLKKADASVQQASRKLLTEIRDTKTDFAERCDNLLSAIR